MAGETWRGVLQDPAADRHLVQIHRDDAFLVDAVAEWVAPPLAAGGGAVLLGRRARTALVLGALRRSGVDVDALRAAGRLAVVDAEALLAEVRPGGVLDEPAFLAWARGAVASVQAACGAGAVRAWGELVDVLRAAGDPAGAMRAEAVWNVVVDERAIRLLCSYRMDPFAAQTYEGPLAEVCAGHSVLLPDADTARFDAAVGRALVDVLGEADAPTARTRLAARRTIPVAMPGASAVLVALHAAEPDVGRSVLAAARRHYETGT